MIEKLSQDVASLSQDQAILNHRVKTLENYPARILHLERDMVGVRRDITLAREEIAEVKTTASDSLELMRRVELEIKKLFWTGAGVALAISIIGASAGLAISFMNTGIFK